MMNVRLRPGGIAFFVLAVAALVYRLLYTLLWEHEGDGGPLLSLLPKKPVPVVAPSASPSPASSPASPLQAPIAAKP